MARKSTLVDFSLPSAEQISRVKGTTGNRRVLRIIHVLELLREDPDIAVKEIAKQTGAGIKTIYKVLDELRQDDFPPGLEPDRSALRPSDVGLDVDDICAISAPIVGANLEESLAILRKRSSKAITGRPFVIMSARTSAPGSEGAHYGFTQFSHAGVSRRERGLVSSRRVMTPFIGEFGGKGEKQQIRETLVQSGFNLSKFEPLMLRTLRRHSGAPNGNVAFLFEKGRIAAREQAVRQLNFLADPIGRALTGIIDEFADRSTEQHDLLSEIHNILEPFGLSARDEKIVAYYILDFSYEEIAGLACVSTDRVGQILCKARVHLDLPLLRKSVMSRIAAGTLPKVVALNQSDLVIARIDELSQED